MRSLPDADHLAISQGHFAKAVLQSRLTMPEGIRPDLRPSSERRFSVYRNNVKASLVAVLAARFPVVARVVGEEFFIAMALVFIEREPPRSPILAEYGGTFAGFLEMFEPATELPYLPDIARLEWARHAAFHAGDAAPAVLDHLAAIPAEQLGATIVGLHPAACVIASPWPIVSIWTTNTHDEVPRAPAAGWTAETALVTRPVREVVVNRLTPGEACLLAELARGIALGEAADFTLHTHPEFDLAAALTVLFDAGAAATLGGFRP